MMTGNLMYSAEDNLITADELARIPTTAPRGNFHQPVGYGDFLDLIKHRLDRAGITIHREEYVTANNGQRFFGTMALGVEGLQSEGMQIVLGVRGSHDQSVPRGLCLGNQVLVCSNLCFSGDIANVSTKQTTNIWARLPGLVDRAIDAVPMLAQREVNRMHAYQEHVFSSPRHGDAALVECHRQGALTAAQLGRAISEWDQPSYEEHAQYGDSAWKLINAVTEAQKPTGTTGANPDLVRDRTVKATKFIDQIVGLTF